MTIAQRYREWPRFQPAELQKRMVRSAKGPGLVAAPALLFTLIHRSARKVNSPKLDFRFTEFSEVACHNAPAAAAASYAQR
jgi:hypothetical protein